MTRWFERGVLASAAFTLPGIAIDGSGTQH